MRRRAGTRITSYGIKIHSGPFATVYACPCCKHTEKFENGRPGVGRGHGLRNGGACFSRMVRHVRDAHPEQPKEQNDGL